MAKNLVITGEAAVQFSNSFAPSIETSQVKISDIGSLIELMAVEDHTSKKDSTRHYQIVSFKTDSSDAERRSFGDFVTRSILVTSLPEKMIDKDSNVYNVADLDGQRVGEVLRNKEGGDVDFSQVENFKIVGVSTFSREGFNEEVGIPLKEYAEYESALKVKQAGDSSATYITGDELVEFCGGAPTLKDDSILNDPSRWNLTAIIELI